MAVALLILHGVLAWLSRSVGIETGNDEAWYLLLARSLRDFEYTDRQLLGNPAHSQYPPGYPAILAVGTMVFGERLQALLAIMVICSVASLVFVYDTIRRCGGSTIALLVIALSAVNPTMIEFSGKLMSETPYLLFSSIAIWAIVRERSGADDPAPGSRWPAVAIATSIYSALIRTFGMTLIAALTLEWLFQRRYRRVFVLAGATALTLGGWMLWTIVAPEHTVGRSYVADAGLIGNGPQSAFSAIAHRVWANASFYASRGVPWVLAQPTIERTIVDNIIGFAMFAGLSAVGVRVLWTQARIVILYLALCCVLLAVWPWTIERFLAPLVPLMLWLMIAGAAKLSSWRPSLRPLLIALAGLMFVWAAARNITWIRAASLCDRSHAWTSSSCFTPTQLGFFEAATYARANTPDSATIFAAKDATFGYVSGRRVFHPSRLQSTSATQLLPELRRQGIDFVLLSSLVPREDQHAQLFVQNCSKFTTVARFQGSSLMLREADSSASRLTADDSCKDLRHHLGVERMERSRILVHPRVR